MSDAVQGMHEDLIRSLSIDAPLLTGMKERGLLSQVDFERIQAMMSNGTARCDTASYFINNILFRWAPGVFVDQLERFRDALAKHDDCANKQFAANFNKLLKKPKSHSNSLVSSNSSCANYHDCVQH